MGDPDYWRERGAGGSRWPAVIFLFAAGLLGDTSLKEATVSNHVDYARAAQTKAHHAHTVKGRVPAGIQGYGGIGAAAEGSPRRNLSKKAKGMTMIGPDRVILAGVVLEHDRPLL